MQFIINKYAAFSTAYSIILLFTEEKCNPCKQTANFKFVIFFYEYFFCQIPQVQDWPAYDFRSKKSSFNLAETDVSGAAHCPNGTKIFREKICRATRRKCCKSPTAFVPKTTASASKKRPTCSRSSLNPISSQGQNYFRYVPW